MLNRAAPQSRQHVAFLFWPDSAEAQARTNLRHLLHDLRSLLPEADRFLHVDTHTLQWQPDAPCTLDVAEFEKAWNEAQKAADPGSRRLALEKAVSLYQGDLLPGCYDDWIRPARERLHSMLQEAMDKLVEVLESERDYPAAIRYAQRLLQFDSLREETYLRLMQLHALNNDRAAALRVYHTCVTTLQRELGVPPNAALRQFHERLLNVESAGALGKSIAALSATSPLVGREWAWAQLRQAWNIASEGKAICVLATGEPGIGKTRLAEEFCQWVKRQGALVTTARSYAAEGRLAYAPIVEWLRSAEFRESVKKLDLIWRSELARLLPELAAAKADEVPADALPENLQRQRMFEALARAIVQEGQPRVLHLDDAHWTDPDTLEWLHYLLRFDLHARLILLITSRPEGLADDHPLAILRHPLTVRGQLIEILLDRLGPEETTKLVENLTGQKLSIDMARHVYQETEGNPLFIVETVRAAAQLRSPLTTLQLPSKAQAAIEARLAQLSPTARDLARAAAVLGRAFRVDVLKYVSKSDDDPLVRDLDELWRQRIVREQGADAYDFSHDKIRDVAYAGLSPARRRQLHQRAAGALETLFAHETDSVSGQIAAHYEQARMLAQAVPYYLRAGRAAHQLSALTEAITYLTRGLDVLKSLPETSERHQLELRLRLTLGAPLLAARGYSFPAVEENFSRAHELCRQAGDTPQLFQALWGLGRYYLVRPDLNAAHAIGQQLLTIAHRTEDQELLLEAHNSLGAFLFHLGRLKSSHDHLLRGYALYDPQQHRHHAYVYGQDPGVVCLTRSAWALWHLGYADHALERSQSAVDLANEVAHPFSQAFAISYAAVLHVFCRDSAAALIQAERGRRVSEKYGIPIFSAIAGFTHGWALAQQGSTDQGLQAMKDGVEVFGAIGAELGIPFMLTRWAEVYGITHRPSLGLDLLARAQAIMERTHERWSEPELHRVRGELLLRSGADETQAAACFERAVAVAQSQAARLPELRATVALARLWQRQGRAADARRTLADLYSGFTEGHHTPDLIEAKALLESL